MPKRAGSVFHTGHIGKAGVFLKTARPVELLKQMLKRTEAPLRQRAHKGKGAVPLAEDKPVPFGMRRLFRADAQAAIVCGKQNIGAGESGTQM